MSKDILQFEHTQIDDNDLQSGMIGTGENIGRLEKAVKALNKKAAKLNLAPITLTYGEPFIARYLKFVGYEQDSHCRSTDVKIYDEIFFEAVRYTLEGPPVVLPGWEFVGTIEHHLAEPTDAEAIAAIDRKPEPANIVAFAPRFQSDLIDVRISNYLHTRENICDHCSTKRRRNETIIIRKTKDGEADGNYIDLDFEKDEIKVVGKNCLDQYLGDNDAKKYAQFLSSWMELAVKGWPVSEHREDFAWPTKLFAAVVSAFIRKAPFISGKKAREESTDARQLTSTANEAFYFLCDVYGPRDVNDRRPRPKVEDLVEKRDLTDSMQALELLRKQDPRNEFQQNAKTAARLPGVSHRRAGVLAAGINSIVRDAERIEAAKKAREGKLNEHVGSIKERLRDLDLTVVFSKYQDGGDWGISTLAKFEDAEGRGYTWWATGDRPFEKGDKVKLTGTVKKHDEHEGRKSTVLSRCIVHEHFTPKDDETKDAISADEVEGLR